MECVRVQDLPEVLLGKLPDASMVQVETEKKIGDSLRSVDQAALIASILIDARGLECLGFFVVANNLKLV